MPDTLVPPEIDNLSEYINWISANNIRWYDAAIQIPTFMSRYLSIETSMSDAEYGSCNGCYSYRVLYNTTMLNTDTLERYGVCGLMCEHCTNDYLARSVFDIYFVSRSVGYDLLGKFMFPEPEHKKDDCVACGYPVPDSNEGTYHINERRVESFNHDQSKTYVTHKMCSESCSHCRTRYVRLGTCRYGYDRPELQPPDFWSVNHINVCDMCWESDSFQDAHDWYSCDYCGSRTENTRYSNYRGDELCLSCYDSYIECDDCGYEWHEDDGHSCEDQEYDDDDDSRIIKSYSYKPDANFFGDAPYHMGIELEVESKGNVDCSVGAHMIDNYLGGRAYYKWDGSLSNGFEIVTHPHSLDEYQNKVKWEFLNELQRNKFRSWNSENCGLHVHVSRTAFRGNSTVSGDAHQLRFLKFIYDNQRQVCRIAGRRSSYARWDDKGNLIAKVKDGANSAGHYSAVNTENYNTIEVRVFKGSLRKERVLSAIEFVHASVEYTRSLKIVPKDKPLSWSRFVHWLVNESKTYPNLLTIINETFDRDEVTATVEE